MSSRSTAITASCGRRERRKLHSKARFYAAERSIMVFVTTSPVKPRRDRDVYPPRRAVFRGVPRLR